jgi:hypothetical protein
MTPTQLKVVNSTAAVLFGLAGLFCFGLAAYLVLTPAPARPAQYLKRTADIPHCLQALTKLGLATNRQGETHIQVEVPQSSVDENPKEYLDKASVGIAACKMQLRRFCMGSDCSTSSAAGKPAAGMSFLLDASDTP